MSPTAAMAARTESSQRESPEPFCQTGSVMRPSRSTETSTSATKASSGHVFRTVPFRAKGVFERVLVYFHRIGTADHGLAAFKFEDDGSPQRAARQSEGPPSAAAAVLASSTGLGRDDGLGSGNLRRFFGRLFGGLGLLRRFFLHHFDGNFLQLLAGENPGARRNKAAPAPASRERRNEMSRFTFDELRFIAAAWAFGAACYLVNDSVAKSTFGTLACWQTSSTARICLYFVLPSPRMMMFKSGSSVRRPMSVWSIFIRRGEFLLVQKQSAVGLDGQCSWPARRIFQSLGGRGQLQVQIIHRRNRRDDEDHQQHERPDPAAGVIVQFRQRMMRRLRTLFMQRLTVRSSRPRALFRRPG